MGANSSTRKKWYEVMSEAREEENNRSNEKQHKKKGSTDGRDEGRRDWSDTEENMDIDRDPPMEPKLNEEGPEHNAMLDLNAPTNDSMAIFPQEQTYQPNTSQTIMHMTIQQNWPQNAYLSLACADLTHTTTIHPYHNIRTHIPTPTNPPRITPPTQPITEPPSPPPQHPHPPESPNYMTQPITSIPMTNQY